MQFVGLVFWWYGDGLKKAGFRVLNRIASLFDYFSIDILLKTLFAPFRQISAGQVSGSLDTKIRAFIDQLISRVIGGIVRSIIVVIGLVAIILAVIAGIVYMVFWLISPILPLVGFSLMLIGWIPWHL